MNNIPNIDINIVDNVDNNILKRHKVSPRHNNNIDNIIEENDALEERHAIIPDNENNKNIFVYKNNTNNNINKNDLHEKNVKNQSDLQSKATNITIVCENKGQKTDIFQNFNVNNIARKKYFTDNISKTFIPTDSIKNIGGVIPKNRHSLQENRLIRQTNCTTLNRKNHRLSADFPANNNNFFIQSLYKNYPQTLRDAEQITLFARNIFSLPILREHRKNSSKNSIAADKNNSLLCNKEEDIFIWLDANSEAFETYFLQRADINLINKWLKAQGYLTLQEYIWQSRRLSSSSRPSVCSLNSSSSPFFDSARSSLVSNSYSGTSRNSSISNTCSNHLHSRHSLTNAATEPRKYLPPKLDLRRLTISEDPYQPIYTPYPCKCNNNVENFLPIFENDANRFSLKEKRKSYGETFQDLIRRASLLTQRNSLPLKRFLHNPHLQTNFNAFCYSQNSNNIQKIQHIPIIFKEAQNNYNFTRVESNLALHKETPTNIKRCHSLNDLLVNAGSISLFDSIKVIGMAEKYEELLKAIEDTIGITNLPKLQLNMLMNASLLTGADVTRFYCLKNMEDASNPQNTGQLLSILTDSEVTEESYVEKRIKERQERTIGDKNKESAPNHLNKSIVPPSMYTLRAQFIAKTMDVPLKTESKILHNINDDKSKMHTRENKDKSLPEINYIDTFDNNSNKPFHIPLTDERNESSLICKCIQTGQIINMFFPLNHDQKDIDEEIDGHYEYLPLNQKVIHSMLLVPLIANHDPPLSESQNLETSQPKVFGVIQLLNKRLQNQPDISSQPGQPFDEMDEIIMAHYAATVSNAFKNAIAFKGFDREGKQNKAFLDLIHDLYEDSDDDLESGIIKILKKALWMLDCDRCQITLQVQDVESPSFVNRSFEVLDMGEDDLNDLNEHQQHSDTRKVYCQSKYRKGDKNLFELNLTTSRSFFMDLEPAPLRKRKPKTTSINSIGTEIINKKKIYMGHIFASDKLNNERFDKYDEELLKIFGIFCGLVYDKSILYLQMADTNAMKSVALEVLSYHVRTPEEDVQRLTYAKIDSAKKLNIEDLMFDDYSLNDFDMIKAVVRMFIDAKFIEEFNINYETLCRWILTTRRNYRKVLYHNWCHAFNVAQTMYAIMKNSKILTQYFEPLDWLAMIVACFSHDLDHRGLNNAYHIKTHSPLEQLYGGEATMEYHHFNMAIMILHTEGHNIFANLKPEDYRRVISLLKVAILATDLSVHFKTRQQFFDMVKATTISQLSSPSPSTVKESVKQEKRNTETLETSNIKFDPKNGDHLKLLMGMLMSACDLSASFKAWDIQKKAVDLVTAEFYTQGDLEKQIFTDQLNPMMDRDKKKEIPQGQETWLTEVCMPLYESLALLDPLFNSIVAALKENRSRWIMTKMAQP